MKLRQIDSFSLARRSIEVFCRLEGIPNRALTVAEAESKVPFADGVTTISKRLENFNYSSDPSL
jgi:hypothetical protein